jgi:hypothetical protein
MKFMAGVQRSSLRRVLATLGLVLVVAVSAHGATFSETETPSLAARAEPETMDNFSRALTAAPTHLLRPRREPRPQPAVVALDRLPAENLARVLAARLPGPLQIGLGRSIAALQSFSETAGMLMWQSTPQGGKIAAIGVVSPDALGLRFGILVGKLPAAAVLRFYAAGSDTAVEVSAQTLLDMVASNRQAGDDSDAGRTYWSPVVEGATTVIEIELPAGIEVRDVNIALPQVSHLFAPLHSKRVSERASSTCNLDVTCQAAWSNESKAVARMIFSSAGGSYLCSGTLLSDKDLSSSIPYFLTANHCISTQTEASSLETYWFYHASACNSSTPYSAARELAGGATLLYANADTDTSFMRLNSSPPVGVVFAGWDTNLPAIGSAVTSIHHPSGDLQKISFGTLDAYQNCLAGSDGYYSCESTVLPSVANHYQITWSSGITEGGSSGSALFLNTHYLIGTLHGGQSYCSTPHEPDDYGRFDRAFSAALYQWLNKTDLLLTRSGSGEGSVSSTTAGIDCGTDCHESYYYSESVTLIATPARGSSFAGWSGACKGTSSSCVLSMNTAQSVTASFNLSSVPRIPTSPTITAISRGQTSATIRFSPGSDGGAPILRFLATCSAPGQSPATASGTTSPLTVSGLTRNVAYSCTLIAQNAAGSSVASAAFAVAAEPVKVNVFPAWLILLD